MVAAASFAVLAMLPSGASAAPSAGCTQTNVADPATLPSEWTCYAQGPQTVNGYEVQQNGLIGIPKPPISGHITKMEVDVVDDTATPVPISRLMLHHIVFFNANRTDAACGGPERFYGAGEERAKLSFPPGYGYPLNPANNWYTVYMYMNHRPVTDHAWIEYKMTVEPSAGMENLRPYWFDVGNCAFDPIYNVPGRERAEIRDCTAPKFKKGTRKKAKKKARRKHAACLQGQREDQQRDAALIPPDPTHNLTKNVTIKRTQGGHDLGGRIIAGAGHVHGGAQRLTLTKPSCPGNPEVARSDPTWGNADHPFYNVKPVLHEPGPIGMSAFGTPTGIPVAHGQTIRLNSIYDNLQPHTRVMGIFITYVDENEPGDPAPDPCAGAPNDIVYGPGTNLPGRSQPPPFTVPLTGLDQFGNAIEIDGPPGAFKTLASGANITVGDRFFSEKNVEITPGTTLNYNFAGTEAHNLTLANGPLGIGSPNYGPGYEPNGTYSQTFSRPGTYRFFCGLHPVQMSQRVVVDDPDPPAKKKKKKKKKKGRKAKRRGK
jgi:plastocyanin